MKWGDNSLGKPSAVLVWVPCQAWERKNVIRNNRIVMLDMRVGSTPTAPTNNQKL